jgi:hypothetical protein
VLCLLWCFESQAQITVTPDKADVGTKVVAVVSADVPEGAIFDGGWSITCPGQQCKAQMAKLDAPRTVGIWGPAGDYQIKYSGFWLLLKEITFKDGDGNEITIQSYLGHGVIDERATFVLEGENGPDPPDPPDPQPNGQWRIVLFYDAATLDDMSRDQQAIMRGEQIKTTLKQLGHELVQRVEGHPSSYPPALRDFVEAVRGKSLPRVALQSPDGGTVFHYPLPETWEGFMTSLNNPQLKKRTK